MNCSKILDKKLISLLAHSHITRFYPTESNYLNSVIKVVTLIPLVTDVHENGNRSQTNKETAIITTPIIM